MLKTTVLGLAAAASLSLAAAALTPDLANYGHCGQEPDAADCQMPGLPPAKGSAAQPSVPKPIVHAHSHQSPARTLPQKS